MCKLHVFCTCPDISNFEHRFTFMHGDTDIANFADDNTPYTSAKNINDVIESLEQASLPPFKWF